MITLYGISNCDTVKKARAWLTAQGLAHRFVDFKKDGLPGDRLPAWCDAVGWATLLNRRGTTWRQLPPDQQAAVTDAASAQAVMREQPSVVKRPVVEWPSGAITVGFDAAAWAALAAA